MGQEKHPAKAYAGELPLNGQNGRIELLGREIRQFKNWQKVSCVSQNGMATCQNFPASVEAIVQANLYAQIGRFRFAGKKEKEQVRCALEKVGMGVCKKADRPSVRRAAAESLAGKKLW